MKSGIAVVLLLITGTARADAGLDLIVLLDRSTSMVRDRHLSPLFLQMTVDLVARNAAANRVDHRLAVVSFGSSARVTMPFAACRVDELPRLRKQIGTLATSDLGDTNFLSAFRVAKELFDALPRDPARKRSIVLLTDGVPYVRGANMSSYRTGLRNFVAANFTTRDVPISVTLLDSRFRVMWRDLATTVRVAGREPDQVLAQSHAAVTGVVGTRTVEASSDRAQARSDVLIVPPYLEMIVFDVFQGPAGAAVDLYPPSSRSPIRGGTNDVEAVRVGHVLATYVVPRPRPGQWIIRKSNPDARVRIVSQQFFPRGQLVRPGPTDAVRQYDRLRLAYRVLDGNGRPLQELPDYALSLDVAVAKPDGVSTRVPMERAADLGPAAFGSTEPSECTLAGRYWTDVRVTTVDDAGRRVDVFHDRWSGFSVAPAERIDCHVQASGMTAWLPMTTEIACFDASRRAIDVNAIAMGPEVDLFRAMLWRDGRVAEAALDLRAAGRGAFRGHLRGATRSGSYKLQLIANRAHLRSPYNIRFIPAELTFAREDVLEWLLLSVVAVAGIAMAILRRGRPAKS